MLTQPGVYFVEISGLADEDNNMIMVHGTGFTSDTDVGPQLIFLTLEGPLIYMQGLNLSRIFSISLYDIEYNYLGGISDISLPRTYLHIEFDSEF